MARKRATRGRGRRDAVPSGQRLLAVDFPNWKAVVERSASTLSADSLRRVRQVRALNREARATERLALAPLADLMRRDPRSRRARNDAVAKIERARRAGVAAPR